MHQQSPDMLNGAAAPSIPATTNITTEQIQKYLDENRELILAIIENQNQGKYAECAPYQAQLQQNLTYLAKIADSQPQPPTAPSQMPSHSTGQQGLFMQQHPQATMSQQQHTQATMSQQQPGPFPTKLPFQLNDQQHQRQQQQQSHYLQQQQLIQGQMGVRPSGMFQAMQQQNGLGNNFMGMQSKQDGSEPNTGDFLGKLASRHNGGTES